MQPPHGHHAPSFGILQPSHFHCKSAYCPWITMLVAYGIHSFVVQMYKGLGVGWATSLLGFISIALLPV